MGKLKNRYIGDKAFYAMVLAICLPIMIQNGFTNFVNLLDNIMVGRIGTEEMSGVSISNQLIFVYNICIFGATSGASIFGAQYFGNKDDEGVRRTLRFKLWLGTLLAVVAIVVFYFFGEALIRLFLQGSDDGGDLEATLHYGNIYLRVMCLGLPGFMVISSYASTLREGGETV
ncbi:MAG: MATE family efflux transporter, partial [Spirochaetales bacterium]|nr:MATE family efflux transporter [Candidatus Physcosoma equi]